MTSKNSPSASVHSSSRRQAWTTDRHSRASRQANSSRSPSPLMFVDARPVLCQSTPASTSVRIVSRMCGGSSGQASAIRATEAGSEQGRVPFDDSECPSVAAECCSGAAPAAHPDCKDWPFNALEKSSCGFDSRRPFERIETANRSCLTTGNNELCRTLESLITSWWYCAASLSFAISCD